MLINFKNATSLFILLTSIHVSAAILNKDEADKADLSLLQNETAVFKSIGMGIALSIAQCDGVDLCSLNVEEDEIKELINALDERIDSLVLKQEEAEDPVAFDQILTAYVNERESYSTHLEKLQSIKSSLDDEGGLLDELESEEPDFPVEEARNEELIQYLNELQELEAFEDEELEDDEDLGALPELEDLNETP